MNPARVFKNTRSVNLQVTVASSKPPVTTARLGHSGSRSVGTVGHKGRRFTQN
jgi:hypothetical protein